MVREKVKVCFLCDAVRAVRWHGAARVSGAVTHICLHVLSGALGLLISFILQLTISCKVEKTAWSHVLLQSSTDEQSVIIQSLLFL